MSDAETRAKIARLFGPKTCPADYEVVVDIRDIARLEPDIFDSIVAPYLPDQVIADLVPDRNRDVPFNHASQGGE